jgi:hypothetical protein
LNLSASAGLDLIGKLDIAILPAFGISYALEEK